MVGTVDVYDFSIGSRVMIRDIYSWYPSVPPPQKTRATPRCHGFSRFYVSGLVLMRIVDGVWGD